jgi:D-alanine-D-alanine ligase-like ATP-grasp enzyme
MQKRRKKESLLLPGLLKKIAPKVGASVYIEPEWGVVGQITFKNGTPISRRSYFRYNTLDLNPVGSSDVAKDKDYATLFMKKMGYPVPPGKTFFRKDFAEAIGSKRTAVAAIAYAKQQGFPLFAKPNSGSQGKNVFRVSNVHELHQALKTIFLDDRVALLQKPVTGRDYRIVVLDKEIISAYERIALNVIGDGKSTIKQLLAKKQRGFTASSRDTRINMNDPRILSKLKRQTLTMQSVLSRGQKISLLDNANLSSGGDAVDVTNAIHNGFKTLAINLTRDMGLRLCGVDVMIEGDIADAPKKYWILEINAAPGLDHYAKAGRAQEKIVEAMYLKVLKAMTK